MIEMNDKIFQFIFKMAFNDATMRKAFPKRPDESELSSIKQKIQSQVEDYIRGYLNNIIDGKINSNETSNIIIKVDEAGKDADERFSFGNAQKLVNMSAKYLYIVTYGNEELRNNFRYCHCPMDSVMIEKAMEYDINGDLRRNISWSQLSSEKGEIPQEYNIFQNIIKEQANELGCFPLEMDYILFG